MPLIVRPPSARWRHAAAAALLVASAACAPGARPAAPPQPACGPGDAPSTPPPTPPEPLPRPAALPATGAVHYLDQLLDAQQGRVVRWDRDRGQPIRVWVPPAPGGLRTAGFVALVDSAMAAWNDVGLPAVFARAADSARADVRVRWARTDREAETVGRASVRIDGRTDHIRSASFVLTTHAASGYPHASSAVLGFALHELGHVLGIQHAGLPECVMFPIPQRTALCAADAETARRWYALPAGLVATH